MSRQVSYSKLAVWRTPKCPSIKYMTNVKIKTSGCVMEKKANRFWRTKNNSIIEYKRQTFLFLPHKQIKILELRRYNKLGIRTKQFVHKLQGLRFIYIRWFLLYPDWQLSISWFNELMSYDSDTHFCCHEFMIVSHIHSDGVYSVLQTKLVT